MVYYHCYWISEYCPSSGILAKKFVSVSSKKMGNTYSVLSLINRPGLPYLLPKDGNKFRF